MWVTEAAIDAWNVALWTTRGSQATCRDGAIQTCQAHDEADHEIATSAPSGRAERLPLYRIAGGPSLCASPYLKQRRP